MTNVLSRFPSFGQRLRPGFFWYSLVADDAPPTVGPDTPSPVQRRPRGSRRGELCRVLVHGRRLAVEVHHALTDGIGATEFLAALVEDYQAGRPGTRRGDSPEQQTDAFPLADAPGLAKSPRADRAYRPSGLRLPVGHYAVTTGWIDATVVRTTASPFSVTDWVLAQVLAALQETEEPDRPAGPLRLIVPVNLRPVFGSATLRNFFAVVPVEIDPRLGRYEDEEILQVVHHQLRALRDPRLLRKQVARNLLGESRWSSRLMPLPAKNLILRAVGDRFDRYHTASVSNLGRWDDQLVARTGVTDAAFVPPPNATCPVNFGVWTCGASLSITVGSLLNDRTIEHRLFSRLRRQGLAVRIESNRSSLEEV